MQAHRDAALARLSRVPKTVQTDGDLRVAAVVVFVAPVLTVIRVSTNSPDVRRHKPVASQVFCKKNPERGMRIVWVGVSQTDTRTKRTEGHDTGTHSGDTTITKIVHLLMALYKKLQ